MLQKYNSYLVHLAFTLLLLFTVEIFASDRLKSNILNSIAYFARDHKIQAAYALSEKGKILVKSAQGFHDLEDNVRLNTNQIMPIVSVTKQMTAVGILLLQDRGLLSASDTVAHVLPASSGVWNDNKVPNWAHKVTIHHLLTHSSGIAEYIWSIKFDEKETLESFTKAAINFVETRRIDFEPGTKYKYIHTNFLLLGVIIEHLTKQTLRDFFKKELFNPAGMRNTYLLSVEESTKMQKGLLSNKFPVRYYAVPSSTTPKFTITPTHHIYAPLGDGGVVSNVEDLIKWNEALHHGKILSSRSYHQMIHPYFKTSDNQTGYPVHMGYGTFISKLHSGKLYYHHTTATSGCRCDTGYIPKDDISIAIISNLMLYVPDEVSKKVDFRRPENQIDISYFRDALLESL